MKSMSSNTLQLLHISHLSCNQSLNFFINSSCIVSKKHQTMIVVFIVYGNAL